MGVKLSLGCLGLIKPEVDLIRTILRTSSKLQGDWMLVDSGECDALLVYDSDKSVAPFAMKPSTQLIMIKRRGEVHTGLVFYKPFRADELVDTLSHVKTNLGESTIPTISEPSGSQTLYRLKKWPSTILLSQHKNFMLLAVYLSRGTKTLENLVTLSGQNEKFCQQFLDMLIEHGLIVAEKKIVSFPGAVHVGVAQVETKKTFLSLLKSRLGISKP